MQKGCRKGCKKDAEKDASPFKQRPLKSSAELFGKVYKRAKEDEAGHHSGQLKRGHLVFMRRPFFETFCSVGAQTGFV